MAKTIILIIIGLALGLAAAAALPYFKQPPNKRTPRPNQFKKNKLKQVIGPAVIGLIVALIAWAGISALFSSHTPDDEKVSNTVTQNLLQPTDNDRIADETIPTSGANDRTAERKTETKPLVVNTPMVKTALAVSPVSSVLERIDVGGRLANQVLLRPTASTKPKPADTKAPAVVESAPPPKPSAATAAPSSTGGLKFTVHLASFGVKENADRAMSNLKSSGVPAYVSTIVIDGKTYYRLMAGSFDSEAQARAYGKKLEEGGLTKDLGPYNVKPYYNDPDSG